jgi:hypothetical protein
MSSDVVLDISGVELGDSVGSLAPMGMSSEVPVFVALTDDNGRNVKTGKQIITMIPVCRI